MGEAQYMYQIALCDDEVAELNRVENMFEDYCKKNHNWIQCWYQ